MVIKVLQKPSIIEIIGQSTIRIAHPKLDGYTRTFLRSPFTAAATAMSVYDNNNFEDNDWFILGEVGDPKTEECDVNGAVTRGSAVTVTNSTEFSHELDDPVTRIFERKLTIYGATTDGGDLVAIRATAAAIDIQWDKPFTEFNLESTDTAYAYYVVKFYDGTTESDASDYVAAAGLARNSVSEMIKRALRLTGSTINKKISEEFLIEAAQQFQEKVQDYGDWIFELVKNDTSITATENENKYAVSALTYEMKYPDSKQGIKRVVFGTKPLDWFSWEEYEDFMNGKIRGELKTSSSAAATSLTLNDTYEFPESGTGYIGEDSFTWDTNTEATGVLSGISASDLESAHTAGDTVWFAITPGEPTKYAIFDGYIYFDYPVDSDYVGYKIKIRYLKKLTALSEMSDTTEIPFYNLAEYYIASRIQYEKGNDKEGDRWEKKFYEQLELQHSRLKLPTLEQTTYYKFPDP